MLNYLRRIRWTVIWWSNWLWWTLTCWWCWITLWVLILLWWQWTTRWLIWLLLLLLLLWTRDWSTLIHWIASSWLWSGHWIRPRTLSRWRIWWLASWWICLQNRNKNLLLNLSFLNGMSLIQRSCVYFLLLFGWLKRGWENLINVSSFPFAFEIIKLKLKRLSMRVKRDLCYCKHINIAQPHQHIFSQTSQQFFFLF